MKALEEIKSKDNRLVKHIKKLGAKKYREENSEFMIEGLRFVEEALRAGAKIEYCFYSRSFKGARVQNVLKKMTDMEVRVYFVDDDIISEICGTNTPQGIAAVIEKQDRKPEDIIDNSTFCVLTDRIQDPGNMGTIIRTAHAANADMVIYSEGTVDPYSPKVLRSTMGSIFHVPVLKSSDIIEAIDLLKEKGFTVYGSSLQGSSLYFNENYREKSAVIIGNEANGIDSTVLKKADRLIKIPMPGSAESLNAAVASGIILFEIVKQRINIDK